jgi:acyl-CoA synthetase (AMP-forming)/AMP-acid ligase II
MQDKINMSGIKYPDLVEMLRFQAKNLTDHTVFTYLLDGESDEQSVTYTELDEQVQMIASRLQHSGAANERVLLLYPPGLDYIRGFFACLYAGAVAVPTYPPDVTRLERTLPRFLLILVLMVGITGKNLILIPIRWLSCSTRPVQQRHHVA